MSSLILIVPILFPIIGGYLLIPLGITNRKIRNGYAMAVVCITSVLCWIALYKVGVVGASLYSFTRGFSIDLRADAPAKMFALMVSLMWPLVMLYAFEYMSASKRTNSFFAFYIMTYGVTLGVAFAANMTTLYMFYEMLSLVTIPLVSYYYDHESMYAARGYAAYLFGCATLGLAAVVAVTLCSQTGRFVYGGDLNGSLSGICLQIVFLLGFFGFGVKAAVFPIHKWLPAASVAPAPVTALLHAVAVVNTGVFSVIRLTYYAIGPDVLRGGWAQTVGLLFASFTLVYAAVIAVRERHVKRRLAYSTVSNLSYMLFGVLLMTPQGLVAGTAHLVFHSMTKITLFLCIGSFMHHTEKEYLSDINGAARHMPLTFAFYTISALSLLGVPLLCVFVSKWRLLLAGAEAGTIPAYIGLFALIISAFLCAIYGLSVSIRAYFPPKGSDRFINADRSDEGGWRMIVPLTIFTACQIVFGLFPGPILKFIEQITQGM